MSEALITYFGCMKNKNSEGATELMHGTDTALVLASLLP